MNSTSENSTETDCPFNRVAKALEALGYPVPVIGMRQDEAARLIAEALEDILAHS